VIAFVVLSTALAVWICGKAESALNQKDPPSVVLDEIVALPIALVGWIVHVLPGNGNVPGPALLFTGSGWIWTGAVFVLFRVLDAAKPWPIRSLQDLPAGWGVVADDVAAALLTAVVVAVSYRLLA
jgi:phosphatidylglycerophosphatase A